MTRAPLDIEGHAHLFEILSCVCNQVAQFEDSVSFTSVRIVNQTVYFDKVVDHGAKVTKKN